jgi:hypothetical protein
VDKAKEDNSDKSVLDVPTFLDRVLLPGKGMVVPEFKFLIGTREFI